MPANCFHPGANIAPIRFCGRHKVVTFYLQVRYGFITDTFPATDGTHSAILATEWKMMFRCGGVDLAVASN